jgi:hypothetical protein
MPNARRVRQDAEAAARRYAEYGNLIAGYNANVDKMNSGNAAAVALYNQQVTDFKEFKKAVEEGREYAVANIGSGGQWGGLDPFEEQRKSWPEGMVPAPATPEQQAQSTAYTTYISKKQEELNAQWRQQQSATGSESNTFENPFPQVYDPASDPNAPPLPQPTWISEDSPEGRKVQMAMAQQGQFAVVKGKDGKIIAADTNERGFANDAGSMVNSVADLGQVPQQIGPLTVGEKQKWVRNEDGTATRYVAKNGQWTPAGGPIKILGWNTPEPVQQTDAGTVPEEPKGWNPSLREKAELESPTVNAAGANMAATMGSYAKTGLMNEASRNNQSLTNSDTGVLNRVMQGIL